MNIEQEKTTQTEAIEQLQHIAQNALHGDEVPNFYVNGFVNGVGFGDAYLILQTNGKTTSVVNMSFATLKTLAENLTAMVSGVEKQLEQEVLTIQQIRDRITT